MTTGLLEKIRRKEARVGVAGPSLRVMALLKRFGAQVVYHDPHVPRIEAGHGIDAMESVPLDPAALTGADAVIILTDHSALEYAEVVRHAALVVDTRNATRAIGQGREKIVKA